MPDPPPTIALVAPEAVVETPRLALEPLSPEHALDLYPGLLDAALYRFIPQEPPTSAKRLEEIYRRLAPRRSPDGQRAWLNWALRLRDGGISVGTLQATVQPSGTAYVASMLLMPHQRRGYATEGLAALLALLFDGYGVERVAAEIDIRNAPSIALVERLGFVRVATHVAADHFKGAPSDEHRYELSRARRTPNPEPPAPAVARNNPTEKTRP